MANQDQNSSPGNTPGSPGNNTGGSGKDPSGSGGPGMPNAGGRTTANNNFMGRGGLIALIIALALVLAVLYMGPARNSKELHWQQFTQYAEEGRFDGAVEVKDDRMIAKLTDDAATDTGHSFVHVKISPETKALRVNQIEIMPGVETKEDAGGGIFLLFLLNWGPFLIIAFLIYFFLFRGLRNAGGGPGGMLGNFGRSKHKLLNKEHSTVTLDDVAGINEAKDEVGEIIEFLKNPKKFQRLGGRVPRGVLLIGSPGCGKTLLAKAVAGEADVPFFSISGSDFVEMFVGVGASRVRDLFKQAKDSSPCIIFLDEIDAVGRKRGSGNFSGGHDEREQTLNAILVEMDGFDSSDQIIVMAATNRSDVLDPALTRPGRFDRSIEVPLPDVVGRFEILKVHSKKIKLSPSVDLDRLARATPMFSGAELEALINEAAIGATLANKDFVEQDDLEEARDKIRFGRANKSRKVEEEERVATAYHEAGHAVIQYLLENADPLHKVTIIPRGQAGGMTMSLPEKDRYGYGMKYIHDTMRVLCGGRIAEERKTQDISSGASMDIKMMTNYARAMVLEWGMSERLGFVNYAPVESGGFIADKPHSDETAHIIDEEIKRFSDEAYQHAVQLIEENWEATVRIAEALLQRETLDSDDVDNLMQGKPLSKLSVAELLEAEKDKAKAASPPPAEPESKPEDDDEQAPGMIPSPA